MAEKPPPMKFMNPTGARRKVEREPAARRPLAGQTIGMLDNHKFNVAEFYQQLEPVLIERFKAQGVVKRRKPSTSEPAPFLEQLAGECSAVVNAIGD